MTVDLFAIFRAGFVRRWHTNPDLAHTCDRIDGHSARVARIILALHPSPSVALIRQALIHDDGEHAVGDMCTPAKEQFPAIADAMEELEIMARVELWGWAQTIHVTDEEFKWLKFADRLDAYMWAAHHAPHVLGGDGWPEAAAWLTEEAKALGCLLPVRRAMQMLEFGYSDVSPEIVELCHAAP